VRTPDLSETPVTFGNLDANRLIVNGIGLDRPAQLREFRKQVT
jgi:hypothetical protein